MSEIAISVNGLSKRYTLGRTQEKYRTARDAVMSLLDTPARILRSLAVGREVRRVDKVTFWALNDISFEVNQGETVGVIGRNGAGKSTLLKVLSRITEPTTGWIDIFGRVGSLLEVGTGFHPELTGRENIFLNGAILGMRRAEIAAKFDEIVAFAEVERFIDTPVKHYSSGMYLRLAFAVAASLDPEILLVDEVLAVGDSSFQKKCLHRMGEVAQQGRTVLFVSHNMAVIRQLCARCIVLDRGKTVFSGLTDEAIDLYTRLGNAGEGATQFDTHESTSRAGTGQGQITKIVLEDDMGEGGTFGVGEPVIVKIHATLHEPVAKMSLGVEIASVNGVMLLNLRCDSQGESFGPFHAEERVVFTVRIPGLPLHPGVYRLEAWIAELGGRRMDHIFGDVSLLLESKGRLQCEKFIQPGRGLFLIDCGWSAESEGPGGS